MKLVDITFKQALLAALALVALGLFLKDVFPFIVLAILILVLYFVVTASVAKRDDEARSKRRAYDEGYEGDDDE